MTNLIRGVSLRGPYIPPDPTAVVSEHVSLGINTLACCLPSRLSHSLPDAYSVGKGDRSIGGVRVSTRMRCKILEGG